MRTEALFTALSLVTLLQQTVNAQANDDHLDALIARLDGLSTHADAKDFLGRPEMSKVMALVPAYFSQIRDVFVREERWSVKASLAYLLVTSANKRDPIVNSRLLSLLGDTNVIVRVIAAQLCAANNLGGERYRNVLIGSEEAKIIHKWRVEPSLNWMASDDLATLGRNAHDILGKGKPYIDPPAWRDGPGGLRSDGDLASVRKSGARALKPEADLAELALLKLLKTSSSHDTMELLMTALENDNGADEGRLSRRFHMVQIMLSHYHPTCTQDSCARSQEYRSRMVAQCEKWVNIITEPVAFYHLLDTLRTNIDVEQARRLLERLRGEHPSASVREFAAKIVDEYAAMKKEAERVHAKGRALAEELRKREQPPPSPKPEKSYGTPKTDVSHSEATPIGPSSNSWVVIIALAGVAISIVVLLIRRYW